jgi:type I site-specific restriction endonuclease
MDTSSLMTKVTVSLNQKGWNRHDLYYYKLEYPIPSINKKQIADIVLIRGRQPICVIEVKRDITELKKPIQQVKGYASALGVNFMFITNGNEIFQVFNNTDVVNIISEFPSVDEFHELLKNSL